LKLIKLNRNCYSFALFFFFLSTTFCPFLIRSNLNVNFQIRKKFIINQYQNGNQRNGVVNIIHDNKLITAWITEGQDGELTGVYARIFDKTGTPITSEFQVNSIYTHLQEDVKVSTNKIGLIAFVWESYWSEKMTSGGISTRVFDFDGNALSEEVLVNQTTLGFQGDPDLSWDNNNNYLVVWEGVNILNTRMNIYLRKFNPQGVPLTAEMIVAENQNGDQLTPKIVVDDEGNCLIVWNQLADSVEESGLYFTILTPELLSISKETKIVPIYYGTLIQTSIIYDNFNKRYIIAWSNYNIETNGYDIFFRFISKDGQLESAIQQVNIQNGTWNVNPVLTLADKKTIIVAWEKYSFDLEKKNIYLRVFDSNGNPLSSEIKLIESNKTCLINNLDLSFIHPNLWIISTVEMMGLDVEAKILEFEYHISQQRSKRLKHVSINH